MEFKITKLSERCFLISALEGKIPKASPSTVSMVVRQIKDEFGLTPSSVRLFWPDDQTGTMIPLLPQKS